MFFFCVNKCAIQASHCIFDMLNSLLLIFNFSSVSLSYSKILHSGHVYICLCHTFAFCVCVILGSLFGIFFQMPSISSPSHLILVHLCFHLFYFCIIFQAFLQAVVDFILFFFFLVFEKCCVDWWSICLFWRHPGVPTGWGKRFLANA